MRLVIATGIYPPDHGGPATFVPALASRATELGWEVQVVTLADNPRVNFEGSWEVLRLKRRQTRPLRMLRTVAMLSQAARKSDVLFANGLFEESAVSATITRTPWVAKFVGDPVWEKYRNLNPNGLSLDEWDRIRHSPSEAIRRKLLTESLRTAKSCITPSFELKTMLHGRSIPAVEFIPNGVHITPTSICDKDIDVVTASRLVPWKNVDKLIAACGRLRASLHIIGDGPMRQELQEYANSLGSGGRVVFHGSLEPEEVRSITDRSKIFALVSTYEGMSFSLLEAMSRQLPVVAGTNPGNEAVIIDGENGLLVNPHSVDEISEALSRLLTSESLANSLGREARKTVEQSFSIGSTLSRTIRLIEGAVE